MPLTPPDSTVRVSLWFWPASATALLYGFDTMKLREWTLRPEVQKNYGDLWPRLYALLCIKESAELLTFKGGAKLYRVEWEANDDDRARGEVERWKIVGYTNGGDVISALSELFGYH